MSRPEINNYIFFLSLQNPNNMFICFHLTICSDHMFSLLIVGESELTTYININF